MKLLMVCLMLVCSTQTFADESSALTKLQNSVSKPKSLSIKRNDANQIVEIRVNGPDLTNEDLALFNEFTKLERLTISHAGYGKNGKTGVDFSGIAQLKDHPTLDYFSAGGAVGEEYLKALSKLENISSLYVQTTSTVDSNWGPIGTMKHLTYLGIRVRNKRMSKLTSAMFKQLMSLDNLESFFLSEMTFGDPDPFVEFVVSRPNLKELTIRRSNLPEEDLDRIKQAKPDLEIIVKE